VSATPQTSGDPSKGALYDAIRFFTVSGTLAVLLSIEGFLIWRASRGGFYAGIRSMASVLLPIVLGSFFFIFRRETLARIRGLRPSLAFLLGAILGASIMIGLRLLALISPVPIPELLVSSTFSLLIFSAGSISHWVYVSSEEQDPLSYFYGVLSGMLAYVVVLGFPPVSHTFF